MGGMPTPRYSAKCAAMSNVSASRASRPKIAGYQHPMTPYHRLATLLAGGGSTRYPFMANKASVWR